MPHYFFDLEQGFECLLDVSGCYADDDAVVLQAIQEVLSDVAEFLESERTLKGNWTMAVSDQSGRLVTKVPI